MEEKCVLLFIANADSNVVKVRVAKHPQHMITFFIFCRLEDLQCGSHQHLILCFQMLVLLKVIKLSFVFCGLVQS